MKNQVLKIIQISVLTLAFLSCNKVTPAGFWRQCNKKFLVKIIIDQGPHGGHSALHWKAPKANTFDPKTIIDFAVKNGWTFVDSAEFSEDQTEKWTFFNIPIFPLTFTGFSDSATNDETYKSFPRWFNGQITVYAFRTGWVAVEPGTDNSIDENGFITINKDKNEFAVYHLWGD